MIPGDLLPHLLEHLHPGRAIDRYGNDVEDWQAATRTPVRGWLQQNTGSEETDQRNAQVGEWLLLCNAYSAGGQPLTVHGADRFAWGETTFEVIGPPGPVHSPQALHHLEIRLRAVEG